MPAPAPGSTSWVSTTAGAATPTADGFRAAAKPSTSSANLNPVGAPPQSGLTLAEEVRGNKLRANVAKTLADSGLAPALQKAVLERVDRLQGAPRLAELERLDKLTGLERVELAFATDVALSAGAPGGQSRLTPPLREALLVGVGQSRLPESPLGQAGVLGRAQAVEAARTLDALEAPSAKVVLSLLERAGKGGPGAPTERALLLKALAARSERLKSPGTAKAALGELEKFAADIRGRPRGELVRTSTARDIEYENTSKFDPANPSAVDDEVDNDGLYQRYESTCGPTVAQMVRAEADPVYARQLHAAKLNDPSLDNPIAREQKEVLERPRLVDPQGRQVKLDAAAEAKFRRTGRAPAGLTIERGEAIPRSEFQRRLVALNDASTRAKLSLEQRQAIERDIAHAPSSSPEDTKLRAEAWDALRKLPKRPLSEADIAGLLRGARSGEGMRLEIALDELARPALHQELRPRALSSDQWPAQLTNLEAQLKTGTPVPLRLTDAKGEGHFVLATDVEGLPGSRRFLISDPSSGRTAVVTEQDLASNGKEPWPQTQLRIPATQVSHAYW